MNVLSREIARAFAAPAADGTMPALRLDMSNLFTRNFLGKIYGLLAKLGVLVDKDSFDEGAIGENLRAFASCVRFRGIPMRTPSQLAPGACTRIATEYAMIAKRNYSTLLHLLLKLCLDVGGRSAEFKRRLLIEAGATGQPAEGDEETIEKAIEAAAAAAEAAAIHQSAAAIHDAFAQAGEDAPADLPAESGLDVHAIDEEAFDRIVVPAQALYYLVRRGVYDLDAAKGKDDTAAVDLLRCCDRALQVFNEVVQPIFACYHSDTVFAKRSPYYDVMAKPYRHLPALFMVHKMLKARGVKLPRITPMAGPQTGHLMVTKTVIKSCLLTVAEEKVFKLYEAAVIAEQVAAAATGDSAAAARADADAKAATARAAAGNVLLPNGDRVDLLETHPWLQRPERLDPNLVALSFVVDPGSIRQVHRPGRDLHFWGCFATDGYDLCLQYSTPEARNKATFKGKGKASAA
ncbi:hypothetical protein H4R21_001049 [Coemansia helicoidea]|uniref:Uncharacterized protein n=1 Tax=Coemansia helicoidea TaxID=1286919 RepID=A0ACC1LEA2_9FUNG|nr:hypothetical protein H4R21_001049 [Coemansia helicoidea]